MDTRLTYSSTLKPNNRILLSAKKWDDRLLRGRPEKGKVASVRCDLQVNHVFSITVKCAENTAWFLSISTRTAECITGLCLLGHISLGFKIFVSEWIPDDWPLRWGPCFDIWLLWLWGRHSTFPLKLVLSMFLVKESLDFTFTPTSKYPGLCQHATWVWLYLHLLWALATLSS